MIKSEPKSQPITSVNPESEKIEPEESKEFKRELKDIQAFLNPNLKDDKCIDVIARFRPMSAEELHEKDQSERSYIINENVIQIEGTNTTSELFKCTKVFGEQATQD